MASLDYVTQTDKSIGVTFADMPENPALLFVNATTGADTPSTSTLLAGGGSGAGEVPIEPGLFGAYCLLAQTRDKTPVFIAQTVVFYIHNAAAAARLKAANKAKAPKKTKTAEKKKTAKKKKKKKR